MGLLIDVFQSSWDIRSYFKLGISKCEIFIQNLPESPCQKNPFTIRTKLFPPLKHCFIMSNFPIIAQPLRHNSLKLWGVLATLRVRNWIYTSPALINSTCLPNSLSSTGKMEPHGSTAMDSMRSSPSKNVISGSKSWLWALVFAPALWSA